MPAWRSFPSSPPLLLRTLSFLGSSSPVPVRPASVLPQESAKPGISYVGALLLCAQEMP